MQGKKSDLPYPNFANQKDPNDCGNLGAQKDFDICDNSVEWDGHGGVHDGPAMREIGH